MENTGKRIEINVAQEFSETPGARYIKNSEKSGEEFRKNLLIPRFLEAEKQNIRLFVDLDGGYGYATSFLEEAFGGLTRIYGKERVKKLLDIKSEDEPRLYNDIEKYINDVE